MSESTHQLPLAISPDDVTISGELAVRSVLNFARLEGKWYRPWEVFSADQHGWPADWEGRIILALVSQGRLTHREPAWLAEIVDGIPAHLNERGYLGAICPEGVCDEQQLAGHSWLLRGLIAYAEWKQDEGSRKIAETILRNVVLPVAANYRGYPLSPADLPTVKGWQLSKLQSKGKSHALSSDLGCAFIMLDGVTEAYRYFQWPELKSMAETMIERFFKIDLEALHVQTHATLTALRGICRYAELTGDKQALRKAKNVFDRYQEVAMTEHYANYNWWGRPRWTEPCAVIDSYILAVWFWRLTGEARYLALSHQIFYTGVAHAFRADGCFGTDWCLGAVPPKEDGEHNPLVLQPRTYEVYWCCTMRGGELFARAGEALFYKQGNAIVLPSFHNGLATIDGLTFRETTGYPYDGKVRLTILEGADGRERVFRFFAPPWRTQSKPALTLNGAKLPVRHSRGFVEIASELKTGDVIEYNFGVGLHVTKAHNPNSVPGAYSFRHGPLLLVLHQPAPEVHNPANPPPASTIASLPCDTEFEPLGRGRHRSRANPDVVLTPVYHIEEFTRPWHARQGLFVAPEPGESK